ncbi:DDE-type integrase/transposase/recombinase [Mesorhizobium abyssinicae]|uniref:DDE-type integrase/transposase/recombinase n=1 Tax=Mesorhizobium abyssinicae TaxID=1209958 RepID=UPI00387DCF54
MTGLDVFQRSESALGFRHNITYVALPTCFVYVAVILDVWSRMIVGYAIGRSARLTMAALKAAIERRRPPSGCIHHSDRGYQGGFKRSSQHRLCSLMAATRQAHLPAFSNPGSFSAGH